MSSLYNRLYKISVGKTASNGITEITSFQTPIEGQEGMEAYQMIAAVSISAESGSPTGQTTKIKLFNLSVDDRNKINDVLGGWVSVQAGYGESYKLSVVTHLPIIFTGHILRVSTERVGDDLITTIEANTGSYINKRAKLTRTFKEKSTVSYIATELANGYIAEAQRQGLLNTQIRVVNALPVAIGATVLKRAYTIEGSLNESLSEFLDGYNCQVVLNNNTVILKAKGEDPTKMQEYIIIEPANVIGRLETVTDNTSVNQTKETSTPRFKLKLYLDSRINLEIKVTLNEDLFVSRDSHQGLYSIVTMDYSMDYRGSDWFVTLEIKEPSKE